MVTTTPQTPPARPSATSHANCSQSTALERMNLLMGCYRRSDANDPEIFGRAIVAVFRRFPESVVIAVTEPATGLPVKIKFLPSIAEIAEACEAACPKPQPPKALAPAKIKKLSDAELDAQFERLGLSGLRPGRKFTPPK